MDVFVRLRVARPDGPDGCWIWQGEIQRSGYGRFWWKNRSWSAHRGSYIAHIGPIPGDMALDHLCCNRACVRPDHLEPVTAAENNRRRDERIAARACARAGEPS